MFWKHEINYILTRDAIDFGRYVVLASGKEKITVRAIQTNGLRKLPDDYIVSPQTINTEDPNGTKIEWYLWEQCED